FSLVLGSNHFFFCIFTRSLFLKVAKIFLFEGKASSSAAIFAFLQYFIAAQRNIPRFNFVYTGAAILGCSRRDSEKTPRWQPRGHDTQFFRPLVQEEEVSSRGSLLARPLRVNSFLPRQLAIG